MGKLMYKPPTRRPGMIDMSNVTVTITTPRPRYSTDANVCIKRINSVVQKLIQTRPSIGVLSCLASAIENIVTGFFEVQKARNTVLENLTRGSNRAGNVARGGNGAGNATRGEAVAHNAAHGIVEAEPTASGSGVTVNVAIGGGSDNAIRRRQGRTGSRGNDRVKDSPAIMEYVDLTGDAEMVDTNNEQPRDAMNEAGQNPPQ